MSSAAAFYDQLDETTFRATDATVGPWDAGSQHAGPPSALLGRALELADPREELMLARVTTEILGPLPTPADLTVTARVARPGKRVEMVEAEMRHGDRLVMVARGWRIARLATDLPDDQEAALPPAMPRESDDDPGNAGGYFTSMEWRWASGHFVALGPATVWARMRVPLVAGEQPSAWQRALCLADSGNGISGRVPMSEWLYINTELTVHLFREPEGEWVCMEAVTLGSRAGVGLATSRLYDPRGQVGTGAQALLVAER